MDDRFLLTKENKGVAMITLEQELKQFAAVATIKVIGIGGAGGNTVNSLIESGCQGFECIVANTDAQALELSKADKKIQIGVKSTKGLGTGANPDIGKRAAEEDLDKLLEAVGEADIVFLAAGMGGGTGSGGAPVLARALREKGILTIAIVTKPFQFEGKRRSLVADQALESLRKDVDTLIVIPNQKLLDMSDEDVSMIEAFGLINEVLGQSVRGISDIITKPGHINVDFADVRAIMRDRGMAVMGTGKASGPGRARKAAENATSSPLLETISIKGAQGVLLNITGGKNLGLHEISQAASVVYEQAHEDANIILGSVIDETLTEEVIVTIIATGCERDNQIKTVTPKRDDVKPAIKEMVQEKQKPVETEIHVKEKAPDSVFAVKDDSVVEATEEVKEENAQAIDLRDLDVPAYLRKQARQEVND